MKLGLLLAALLVVNFAFAQISTDNSINNKNYYDYFQDVRGSIIP
jgi:hypothetical protein